MRFHKEMIYRNNILYPSLKNKESFDAISIHIDEMILDNTFCDPIFKFPDRDEAFVNRKLFMKKENALRNS
jgi:hypothetical protein